MNYVYMAIVIEKAAMMVMEVLYTNLSVNLYIMIIKSSINLEVNVEKDIAPNCKSKQCDLQL